MRVLITGSRQWTDQSKLYATLDSLFRHWIESGANMIDEETDFIVIHGNAPGADTLANQWTWDRRNLPISPSVEVHPADWSNNADVLAGHRRNFEMVQLGADVVIGFLVPGAANRGTRNCLELAKNWLTHRGTTIKEIWE